MDKTTFTLLIFMCVLHLSIKTPQLSVNWVCELHVSVGSHSLKPPLLKKGGKSNKRTIVDSITLPGLIRKW